VVEQPPRGGTQLSAPSSSTATKGPAQGNRESYAEDVAAVGSTTTTYPQLPRPAGEVRAWSSRHDLIEEAWNPDLEQKGLRAHEVSRSSSPPAGWRTTWRNRPDGPTRTSSGSSTKYQAGMTSTASGGRTTNRLSMPNGHHPIVAESVDYAYPAPLLDVHGPVAWSVRDMVMDEGSTASGVPTATRGMPVDGRPTRFRPDLPGPGDPEHGPAHRATVNGRPCITAWNWADVVFGHGLRGATTARTMTRRSRT